LQHEDSLSARARLDAPAATVDEKARRTDRVPGGNLALGVLVVAWVVVLALYLRHRIVLSSDSMNNYVHVWWIARDLWHHGRLPWRMPVLGHGDAFAYPYGVTNWTTAAIVWPLFGDWSVTLWTALGTAACIAATFVAFPELRRGYWAAAVLANSALIHALLFGQQSFIWGAALLLVGVACWRQGHPLAAALLVGLGQATHPAIVLPIGVVLVALCLPWVSERGKLLRWYGLSVLIALPAALLVFASPTYADADTGSRVVNFFGTLGPRVLIVVLPLFYTLLRRTGVRAFAPAALLLSLIANASFEAPLNVRFQWGALNRTVSTASLDSFLHSNRFVPGATYRLLRGAGDGKLGMYRLLRAGGRLDSELFPESMAIRDFHSLSEYEELLCRRHVDFIVHDRSYDVSRRTNEHEYIASLAVAPDEPVRLTLVERRPGHEVYAVDRHGCGSVVADGRG
jgi:hypothetical protein